MDALSTRLIQRGSPFELQDSAINGIKCKIYPRGPQTIQDVFIKTTSFGKSEFIVSGNERLSFRQAIEQAYAFSTYLQERYGIAKDDRVALLMANCAEWAVAFMAIFLAAATAVIIHTDAATEAVFTAFDTDNCALIVTNREYAEKLEVGHPACPVIVISNSRGPDTTSCNSDVFILPEIINNENTLLLDKIPRPAPDNEALIAFTSGSTGSPKGVVLSHRNLATGLMNMMLGGYLMNHRTAKKKTKSISVPSNLQPCSLLLSPLSHISGFAHILLMCWLGGKIVLMPEWGVRQAMSLIEKEKVRSLNGVSHEMIKELLRADHSSYNLESLTNINLHGSALTPSLLAEITEKLPHITIGAGYGMTETCGSISNISGAELSNSPGACGHVLPSVDIKIMGDDEKEKPIGKTGEICIRGAMIMKGYCEDLKNISEVIKDGWLRTGDIGRIDSEGQLYVTDRSGDIIIYGDNRISTREIEHRVTENDMLHEAVLLVFPEGHCEKLVLVTLPKQEKQIDEQDLEFQLTQVLNNFPIVPKIFFVKSLPRTVSGKINRKELRHQIIDKI
jgi:long-chain acyl-CoA synthetase